MKRLANLAGTLASVVALAGCAAQPTRKLSSGSLTVPAETAQKYQDPIAASALRERALDMLTSMVQDKDPQLRANAIEAMSVTPVRLESLLGPALRDENPGVRSTAAQMIGKAQLRNSVAAVRPLLNDSSPFPRASAIYALKRCGENVDLTPLGQLLLGDPSPRVQIGRAHV